MDEMRPGSKIGGRYSINALIGRGGTARTYLARDSRSGGNVVLKILAIKELREWKSLELFQREAETLRTLDHPLIPDYIDHFEAELAGEPVRVLVQEHADGPNLHTLVKNGKRFTENEARSVLSDLLGILSYIHSLHPPVIHRDIKPGNVILNRAGRAFLVDFSGVGTVRPTAEEAARSDTFVGTAGYMPPEQYFGKVYPQSDLYALGVTMIFLLTGREPFELEMAGGRPEYASRASVPPDLKALIDVLTEADKAKRPRSAARALALLRHHTLIKEAVRVEREAGAVRLGPSHGPLRFHLTASLDEPLGKKGLAYFMNAAELAFNQTGEAHPQSRERSAQWVWDGSPSLTLKAESGNAGTRIDANRPAFSGGSLILLGAYTAFLGMFLIGSLPALSAALFKPAPAVAYGLWHWLSVSAGGFLLSLGVKWLTAFFGLRRSFRRLIWLLSNLRPGKGNVAVTEILLEMTRSAPGTGSRPALSDIRLRLLTKWTADEKKNRNAPGDIHRAAERVLARREGKYRPIGLGRRWTHDKSPWMITCLPRETGTEIEFRADRRAYGTLYATVFFVMLFIGWMILTGLMSGREEPELTAYPWVFFLGLLAAPLGRFLNVVICLFYRARIKPAARRFVSELEERDSGSP